MDKETEAKLRSVYANIDLMVKDAEGELNIQRQIHKNPQDPNLSGSAKRYTAWSRAQGFLLREFPFLKSEEEKEGET